MIMPKPMKYREIRKALLTPGCTYRDATGDHESGTAHAEITWPS